MEDVHQQWHQAEQTYFDPEQFRLAIQTAIQTLRTVTFILQKHKGQIPNFEAWYGVWQQRLAAESLMRWMVDARNKIEKQGDLEAQSFVRAEIIASYLNEGPRIDVPAKLFETPAELLAAIPRRELLEHVRKHGALRIQRRWVESTLPDYELLDAVAIAYGRIAELVHDAHRQMGLDTPTTTDTATGEQFGDGAPIEWLIAAADLAERPSIGDAIEFGYWFGQNPSDLIELPANLLEKSPLEIRRNKTGARCILPIARVPELVERILAGQERRKSLKVQPVTWLYNEGTGRAYKRDHFTHCVSEVRDVAYSLAAAAGDAGMAQAIAGFQYAKLRHTGITAFAGAGATKYEIHNIMGHSLATIDAVLEHHYLAPNVAAPEIAIDKRVKGEGR